MSKTKRLATESEVTLAVQHSTDYRQGAIFWMSVADVL